MDKLSPKVDVVFRKLFGSEKSKDILVSLVNSSIISGWNLGWEHTDTPFRAKDRKELAPDKEYEYWARGVTGECRDNLINCNRLF